MDENQAIALVHGTIEANCKWGNIVIIGRGGQGILKDKPGVLHVRIEAPLDIRVKRIQDQENVGPTAAQEKATQRDKAAADYLMRFYDIDWADPMLYDLAINTGKLGVDAAAHLIVNAVGYLPPTESSG